MKTVSGLFDTYQQATEAVHALNAAGITSADISLVANRPEDLTPEASAIGKDATAGAEVGAILGGAGGLLAGLGVLAVPGLGAVVASGWLVAALMGAAAGAGLGAATGGLIGLLTDAGIPKADARVYAEGVRRGGALVTARVTEAQETTAAEVLAKGGAADPAGLRERYEAEGWDPLAERPVDIVAEEVRDYNARNPFVPPVV